MSYFTSKVVIDIETDVVQEKYTTPYDGPWELCKESDAQKQAQAAQTAFTQQLTQIYNTQFQQQQAILSVLTPQLESMASNPQGFGANEYAAMQAGIVNTTGAQYANAAKAAATDFAVRNEAGLPSGVEAQVQANLTGQAAGQVAGQSSQLTIANEQLKQQQQQLALGSLLNLNSSSGSQMTATGGQVGQGLQNQFQNATTVYNQGSLWSNILGGLAGAGLNFLAGGFSDSGSSGFGSPGSGSTPLGPGFSTGGIPPSVY